MTAILHPTGPAAPSPPPSTGEQHLVLRNVPWENYVAIGQLFADRPALRLTYDRGTLEFMTTSSRHEIFKHWLGRFVETIAEESSKPIAPAGSMTFQREDLERGFEPDNCYWIAKEPAVRGKLTWEADKDPPPDLMLEIEVSHSALARMKIFAAFHVPEVWCFDGQAIRIDLLQSDGSYLRSEHSLAFPTIPITELVQFLKMIETTDYLSAVAAVRAWVRAHIAKAP
jgi:Uma2 family endonuclease